MNYKDSIIFLAQSTKFEIESTKTLSFPDKFAKQIGELHSYKKLCVIAQQGASLDAENVCGADAANSGLSRK